MPSHSDYEFEDESQKPEYSPDSYGHRKNEKSLDEEEMEDFSEEDNYHDKDGMEEGTAEEDYQQMHRVHVQGYPVVR